MFLKAKHFNTLLNFKLFTMDTETVLQIIAMLDRRIKTAQYEYLDAYTQFRDYLQEYIESEVSKAEDQMNEGGY